MLVILSLLTIFFVINNIQVNVVNVLLYFLLLINGLIIASAFHIFVLGIGVMTTSVDHLISIYRDMTSMMRIPVDLYVEPIRSFLTFVVPLGIMITFPAKAFLGYWDLKLIVLSLILGATSLFFAINFWNYAIKKYSSASS